MEGKYVYTIHLSILLIPYSDSGTCPTGYPVRLPSIFYENTWDTKGVQGLTWSSGDPTGWGHHGGNTNQIGHYTSEWTLI